MAELREADLRALHALDEVLADLDDPEAFGPAVLAPVTTFVPCDYATYNEIDVHRRRAIAAVEPWDALAGTDFDAFQRHVGQHPVVAYSRRTGDGRAHTISDFLDRRSFHRTDLYATFFRSTRAEHQVAITLTYTPSLVVGIALNRSKGDFTARDRLLLNLVRTHLVVAHHSLTRILERNHYVSALETALADTGRGVILTTASGRVVEASREAQRLLSTHGGVTLTSGTVLPPRIASLVTTPAAHAQTLLLEGHGARLYLRHLGSTENGHCVVAVDARTGNQPPPLAAANLTGREQEILAMLSASKDNSRIAAELGVSVRTVHKHLEHIYAKLDVGDRTSAAARWLSERLC